jgi:flagellar biogenesis protein FliO
MLPSVLSALLVLALLGGLLLWLRRLSPAQARGRCLRLLETVQMGNGKALSIARVGDRYFLLAATQAGIGLIAELEAGDLPQETRAPAPAGLWNIRRWVNGSFDARDPPEGDCG